MKRIHEFPDLLVFSHLRWDFVFQRPQHLLTRYASIRRVFYFEEPLFDVSPVVKLMVRTTPEGVTILTPCLLTNPDVDDRIDEIKFLLDAFLQDNGISNYSTWYYTPMALPFSRHLQPQSVIYDCMDELSHFKFAHPELKTFEAELMRMADVVFTGGHSLYEAKKTFHSNIHPFPSSIDREHFAKAREETSELPDQDKIPGPRLGFFGVVDERMDIDLLREIAELRPEWQFVIIGPVVKIDPATLPKNPNIHYLGKKCYQELPAYLRGWDVAMMPFALNDSTRFISPTKTPEYLAAGKPVVSTAIRDVVHPYGTNGLVAIAHSAKEFVLAAEKALYMNGTRAPWLARVDEFLKNNSWNNTWQGMVSLEQQVYQSKKSKRAGLFQNNPLTVNAGY